MGAQKLDKLGTTTRNWGEMDKKYNFSKRLAAENISMMNKARLLSQQIKAREQYGHKLYSTSVDLDKNRFAAPPGVNTEIFSTKKSQLDGQIKSELDNLFGDDPVKRLSFRVAWTKRKISSELLKRMQIAKTFNIRPILVCACRNKAS